MIPRLILASSSPRRRQMVAAMGLDCTIIKPNIDETRLPDETPHAYVSRLSRQKAHAVAQQITAIHDAHTVMLAADTVVILAADTTGWQGDGVILGKPTNPEEARATLKRLRQRPHQVCTSFTILHTSAAASTIDEHSETVYTTVHMRNYTDAEIEAYIATGDPFDKAGGYAIQHAGFAPVARIEGSYTNVVGLPSRQVAAALRRFGVPAQDVPDDAPSII